MGGLYFQFNKTLKRTRNPGKTAGVAGLPFNWGRHCGMRSPESGNKKNFASKFRATTQAARNCNVSEFLLVGVETHRFHDIVDHWEILPAGTIAVPA